MKYTTKQECEQAEARLVHLYHATNTQRTDIKLKLDFLNAWKCWNEMKTQNSFHATTQKVNLYEPDMSKMPSFRKIFAKVTLYAEKYM